MAEYRNFRAGGSEVRLSTTFYNCFFVFCSFIITCAVFNQAISQRFWQPDLGEISLKLEAFGESDQPNSILFFGSSHINYAVSPAAVDKILNVQHPEISSYNLGISGMTLSEREHMLREALRINGNKTKFVVIELELRTTPLFANLQTKRKRFFASPEFVSSALWAKLDSRRPLKKRLIASGMIGTTFLLNQLNLGVGSDILLPPANKPKLHSEYQFSNAGWRDGEALLAKRNLDRISDSIARASKEKVVPRELTEAEFASMESDLKIIEASGCTPVILFPPACLGLDDVYSIRNRILQSFPELVVIDTTPESPEWRLFCQPELWIDEAHLSKSGAEIYSQLIAQQLNAILETSLKSDGTSRR